MLKIIRKTMLPKPFYWLVTGLLLGLTGIGCNTRIEGCLQANAENFDLNAERPCDGCCLYPSMGLSLTQKWGDRNFSNGDTLYDVQGNPYKILDLKYFLSSWVWRDTEGNYITVDSVEAGCDESTLRFTTDNLIMDSRQFVYTLGTIRESPLIDSLQLALGLYQDFSCLDTSDTDTPVSLTNQSPLWNVKTGTLETIRLILQLNLDQEATDTLFVTTNDFIRLEYLLQLKPGTDAQLDLTVDYSQWFSNVNVNDLNSFGHSIETNFAGSVIRTP